MSLCLLHVHAQELVLTPELETAPPAAAQPSISFQFYFNALLQHPVSLHELPDGRLDLCLLLLPPRGALSAGLLQAAASLAAEVPVLPLLAMASVFWAGLGPLAAQPLC